MSNGGKVPLSTQLIGPRVLLRAPKPSDIPELRTLLRENADHLRPWSPSLPRGHGPPTITELSRSVARYRHEWKDDTAYVFVVALREPSAPLVGRIALTSIVRGPFQNAHLGYWTAASYQGLGLATEAARLIVDFGFDLLALHRLEAAVMPHNGASRRILTKRGFREEGLAKRYLAIAGQWQDHILYGLTREEWEAARGSISP